MWFFFGCCARPLVFGFRLCAHTGTSVCARGIVAAQQSHVGSNASTCCIVTSALQAGWLRSVKTSLQTTQCWCWCWSLVPCPSPPFPPSPHCNEGSKSPSHLHTRCVRHRCGIPYARACPVFASIGHVHLHTPGRFLLPFSFSSLPPLTSSPLSFFFSFFFPLYFSLEYECACRRLIRL